MLTSLLDTMLGALWGVVWR